MTKRDFKLHRFPNGEFKITTIKNILNKEPITWLYGDKFEDGNTLKSPSEELIALLQLNLLLEKFDVKVIVKTDYIPFRRQDKEKLLGEVKTNQMIDPLLKNIRLEEAIPHDIYKGATPRDKYKLSFGGSDWPDQANLNSHLFKDYLKEDEILVFPDQGAEKRFDKREGSYILFMKSRHSTRTDLVEFEPISDVDRMKVLGKKIVIWDDIITTGKTLSHIAKEVKKYGALYVKLVVNHSDGLFKESDMLKNGIDEIVVLNGGHKVQTFGGK